MGAIVARRGRGNQSVHRWHNGGVTDPDAEARITARYPARSAADTLIATLAGLGILAAIVLVVWAGLERSNPPVAAMVRSFEIVSPALTTAEIVVQRGDPSQPATCFMYAQAASYERVAELDLQIPPGTEKLTQLDVEVKTVKEATSVSIEDCRIAG